MSSDEDGDDRAGLLERVLAVLNELLEGKEHDRHSIARLGGVKPSTADRDIRALVRFPGVRAVKEGNRKVLRFDRKRLLSGSSQPTDAAVIAACLGTALASVFDGSAYERGMREALQYVLAGAKRQRRFRDADRKFIFVHRGGEAALREKDGVLDDVIEALLHSRYLAITYRHFKGESDSIRLMPLSLAIYDHQLYVIGRTTDSSFYPYRFSRIQSATVQAAKFEYPLRSDYDPDQVFQHSFGIFIGNANEIATIEVLLSREWETYAHTHRWHPSQRTTPHPDGVLVTMQVRLCRELETWILGFGEEAQVLRPASLVKKIGSRVGAMAKKYKVGPGTTPRATGRRSVQKRRSAKSA